MSKIPVPEFCKCTNSPVRFDGKCAYCEICGKQVKVKQ